MTAVEDLRTHLHHYLKTEPYVGGQDVQFELVDRDVLLIGSVRSYFQKQMAQERVLQIAGVRRIVNVLKVMRSEKTSRGIPPDVAVH